MATLNLWSVTSYPSFVSSALAADRYQVISRRCVLCLIGNQFVCIESFEGFKVIDLIHRTQFSTAVSIPLGPDWSSTAFI